MSNIFADYPALSIDRNTIWRTIALVKPPNLPIRHIYSLYVLPNLNRNINTLKGSRDAFTVSYNPKSSGTRVVHGDSEVSDCCTICVLFNCVVRGAELGDGPIGNPQAKIPPPPANPKNRERSVTKENIGLPVRIPVSFNLSTVLC